MLRVLQVDIADFGAGAPPLTKFGAIGDSAFRIDGRNAVCVLRFAADLATLALKPGCFVAGD